METDPITTDAPQPPPQDQDNNASLDDSTTSRSVKFDDSVVEKREYNIKLEKTIMQSEHSKETVIGLFTSILSMIDQHFSQEVTIFTNKSIRLKRNKKITEDKFTRYFNIHEHYPRRPNEPPRPSTPSNGSPTTYVICMSLRTDLPLSRIKRHPSIVKFLEESRVFMRYHAWRNLQWDTVTVGWLLHHHPGRETETDIKAQLKAKIDQHKELHASDVPDYRLIRSRQRFAKKTTNQTIETEAFELQCLRSSKVKLEAAFMKLFDKKEDFIRTSLKYKDPELYCKVLQVQKHFIDNFRSIKLTGVSKSKMFYLENHILALPGVHSITEPWNSHENGKWLVNTTERQFVKVGTSLSIKWIDWIKNKLPSSERQNLDENPPTVHFTYFGTPTTDWSDGDHEGNDGNSTIASAKSYETQARSYISTLFNDLEAEQIEPASINQTLLTPSKPKEILIDTGTTASKRSWASIASLPTNSKTSKSTPLSELTTSNASSSRATTLQEANQKINSLEEQIKNLTLQLNQYNSPQSPQIELPHLQAQLQKMEQQHSKMNSIIQEQNEMLLMWIKTMVRDETPTTAQPSQHNPVTNEILKKAQHIAESFHQPTRPSFRTPLNPSTSIFHTPQKSPRKPSPQAPPPLSPLSPKNLLHIPANTSLEDTSPITTNSVSSESLHTSREGKRRTSSSSASSSPPDDDTSHSPSSKRRDAKSTPTRHESQKDSLSSTYTHNSRITTQSESQHHHDVSREIIQTSICTGTTNSTSSTGTTSPLLTQTDSHRKLLSAPKKVPNSLGHEQK